MRAAARPRGGTCLCFETQRDRRVSVDSSQNTKVERRATALKLAAFSEASIAAECAHGVRMAGLQQPMCVL